MKTFKKVTHLLFDLDGVLIDSEPGYYNIISKIAKKYGKEYTHEVKMKILGTPEMDTARIAIEEMKLPLTQDEFIKMFRNMIFKEITYPPLHEGAKKLISHLHKHNIPFALATSSSREATDVKLQNYTELFSKFHHKVMGSTDPDVKRGKPHPDIFLVCASRFPDKPNPEQCLVFEDAPNGVKAAVSAGMQVVMIPERDISDELRKQATTVIKSLNEFKPELFGLPAFS